MGSASILSSSEAVLYNVLYNPLPGIHRRTLDHPVVDELRGAPAFHSAGVTMIATSSLRQQLSARDFKRLGAWT